MSITETTLADNPGNESRHTESTERTKSIERKNSAATQAAQELRKLAEKIITRATTAAQNGDGFDQTERASWNSVLQIGFQAMQLFVALQGDGDLGPHVQTEDGKTLIRSKTSTATILRSVFGEHTFKQFTYAAGKRKAIELRPVSARMSLPQCRWTHLLQEFSQVFCVEQAYGQAAANLKLVLNDEFSVDTVEAINQNMRRSAGAFLADLPKPEPDSEAKLLVASADCKGVPLIKEDNEKVPAFETAKKNPGNRKMATVTSVYTVDPHVRTPEEITAALFREDRAAAETAVQGIAAEPDAKPARPEPQNKNTTAHFPTTTTDESGESNIISGILVGVAWIMNQIALRRRVGQILIVLMDGQESLWNAFAERLPFTQKTVPILDILHALAYVWKAAGLFCTTKAERMAFTRMRLLRILNGEVLSVVRGLRQMGTTHKLKGEDLKTLTTVCNYLQHNASRMRYDEYLRRGYPIASGVIEGACRHLVKDRMECSGMRWTLEGARNMLNVRAAHQSDHWRKFLNDHIANDTDKAHPHRNLIHHYKPTILPC